MQRQLGSYFAGQFRILLHSLGRVFQSPWQSLVTVLIIGIALALPTGFWVLLQNSQYLTANLKHTASISVYLQQDLSTEQITSTQQTLSARDDIASVTYVSPEDGLQQLQQQAGFSEIIADLPENPLPPVLVIEPFEQSYAALTDLLAELNALPKVELVQADLDWVNKLNSLLAFAEQLTAILALFLAMAVLFVVSHAIYFALHRHRHEIAVIYLIGGTESFIRRPFLYSGLWFGLLGAVLAGIMVWITITWLRPSLATVMSYYSSDFVLQGLSLAQWGYLAISGALLGYIGAWLATQRYLKGIIH